MKNLLVVVFLCALCASCAYHRPVLQASHTTQVERTKFKRDLIKTTIEQGLAEELTAKNESKWEGSFWGISLTRYKSENTTQAISRAFAQFDERSVTFQRALLEVVYTIYPDNFVSEVDRVIRTTKNEKLFAMAAVHYNRATKWRDVTRVRDQMWQSFPLHASHPILRMLDVELQEKITGKVTAIPPVVNLLSAPVEKSKAVIFSLQRKDRRFPGLAVVRDVDGKFVKVDRNKYFAITQLALAASNLPGYLTDGNTPQGIHSVQGLAFVKNKFIGPTETIQLVLPHEAPPQAYFHDATKAGEQWTPAMYANLLPASWKNFEPIYTAYFAGEAGRSEIISHGTTIDPSFYANEPCYPISPSMGCLTASELWSGKTGANVKSDQQKLVDVLRKTRFEKSYFVVVELNDEARSVSLDEVVPLIRQAEKLFFVRSIPAMK